MSAADDRASLTDRAKSHWAEVAGAVHDRIRDKVNAAKKEHLTDVLETFERDLAPHVAPVLASLVDNPALPEPLRALLKEVSEPTHLTSSLIVGIAVGAILSPAIQSAFAPVIQTLDNEVWPLDPSIPLSPNVLALGVLKGVIEAGAAATEAGMSGMGPNRFAKLVETEGNAIGIAEALLLWRRDQIGDDELTAVMQYSNLNPKFYDMVRMLRYQPPGAASVLAGAVQGHLEIPAARDKYEEAGGNPVNFDWQYETTGRPPGAEQMLHLLNRDLMSEAEVRAAIRESDIKNKYTQAIIDSRVYLPPPRSVVPMLRHGAITEAKARELLGNHGVTPADQDSYIAEASHSATASGRHLTQSQTLRMYEAHFIDRGTASSRLAALNYPTDEIELLLNFTDEQRRERYMNAALSKVRTLYVGHKVGKPIATNALGELGFDGAQQADIFAVWDIERTTAAPNLTVAQWQGALRRGLVTHAEFDAALVTHGYSGPEIDLLAGLAFPPPRAPKAQNTRDLSVSQLVKLYQGGSLTRGALVARLEALGYSAPESNEIVALAAAPGPTP